MLIIKAFLLLTSLETITVCTGYRILGIFVLPSVSHYNLAMELFKGLAHRGHQVDIINIFPEKEKVPNLTQIITLTPKSLESVSSYSFVKSSYRGYGNVRFIANELCEFLSHPGIFNLINNPPMDPPFDAVITQLRISPCFLIVGHLWKVPNIIVSATSLYPWMHDMIGNPENIAISPNVGVDITSGVLVESFWSRFCNTFWFYYIKLLYLYHLTKDQDTIIEKYFGPELPSVYELDKNVSLVLANTHYTIHEPKPMAKNLIEIGGIHIQNNGPELSHTLKKWLDKSKDGVVYFNFGSRYRIEILPEEKVRMIFRSLENIAPIRVLMKVNKPEELTVKIPSNVYTLRWVPQEKVLQHPNTKVFITQGGAMSTQEAAHYGVPIICIPLVADQFSNARNYVKLKIAIMIDISELSQEQFDAALDEILKNPIYNKNAKKLSQLFRDRPQSAMETAIYWTEYVIRNGKDSLRSPIMDLTWWQVASLDVFAVMILGLLIIIFIVMYFLKISSKLIKWKTTDVSESKKK